MDERRDLWEEQADRESEQLAGGVTGYESVETRGEWGGGGGD